MSEKLNKKGLERLWDKILLLADYIQGKISALEKSMPEQAKNGKLTIQKNGTEVQTFSANQGTDATANILVPTISNSAAVTQTGQMALDATEKNASIEGTLAHQIAQVNGSLSAWELIGSSVGKAPVTFEADIYSEITCICQIPVSGTSDIYQIPTIVLGSTEKIFSHGNSGYKAIGTFFVNIYASSTSIRIQYAEANSGDVTNQANFSVYGR